MKCTDICGDSLTFPLALIWDFCFILWTVTGWIATQFGADIRGAQSMNPNEFGDSELFM